MPDAEGYHIDDPGLPQITAPAGVSGGVFELGFTTAGVRSSKRLPIGVLLQFLNRNLAGPNNRPDGRKIVRYFSSTHPDFGTQGSDSALDTLPAEFLCLGTECEVEFAENGEQNVEYVLRYHPAGPLSVFRDGNFQPGVTVPARWFRKGSAAAAAAGVPAFNPLTTRYPAESQVVYQSRFWQTPTELLRASYQDGRIPAPAETAGNPWREISSASSLQVEQTIGRTLLQELLGEDQIDAKRIYRITGRPDGQDVLVRGLSAAGLAYADAYTVPAGADAPQTPVSYDISTDTVSPRASGGGDPTLPGRVSTLETDLNQAENDINTLENEVAEHETQLADLTTLTAGIGYTFFPDDGTQKPVKNGGYYYDDISGVYKYIGPDGTQDYINIYNSGLWEKSLLVPRQLPLLEGGMRMTDAALVQYAGIPLVASSYFTVNTDPALDIAAGRFAVFARAVRQVVASTNGQSFALTPLYRQGIEIALQAGHTISIGYSTGGIQPPPGTDFLLTITGFDPARVAFAPASFEAEPGVSGLSGTVHVRLEVTAANKWRVVSVTQATASAATGGGSSYTDQQAVVAVRTAGVDIYNVPQAVRDAVSGGTFANGELQGTQPAGSVSGQRFTTTAYGYEFERGAAGTLVWCRYPKG